MSKKKFINIENFYGGLNTQINSTMLADNELSVAYDISYRDGGASVRPQYKVNGDISPFFSTNISSATEHISSYGLGKRSFAAFDVSIDSARPLRNKIFVGLSVDPNYEVSSGVYESRTILKLSKIGYSYGYYPDDSVLYLCGDDSGAWQNIKQYSISGTDYFVFHDYGTKRLKKGTIASTPTISTLGADTDREGCIFEVFSGRLFYTDSATPGRLLYTTIGGETYSGYIEITGKEAIVSLLSANDSLYVLTVKNMHLVTGRSALSFSTRVILKNVEARQIVEYKGRVIFKNNFGEIFMWDGYGNQIDISKKIKGNSSRFSVFNIFKDRLFVSPISATKYTTSIPELLVYDLSLIGGSNLPPSALWRISDYDASIYADVAIDYMYDRYFVTPKKTKAYFVGNERFSKERRIAYFENDDLDSPFLPSLYQVGIDGYFGSTEYNYDKHCYYSWVSGAGGTYSVIGGKIKTKLKTKKLSFGAIQSDKRMYRVYNHTNGDGTYKITVDTSGYNNEQSFDNTYTVTISGSNHEYVKNVDCETGNLHGRFVAITSEIISGTEAVWSTPRSEKQSIDGMTIEIDSEAP